MLQLTGGTDEMRPEAMQSLLKLGGEKAREGIEALKRLAALPGLRMQGVAVHIGSQLQHLQPLEDAFGKLGALIAELRANGQTVTHADLGGGLGVPYRVGEVFPSPEEYGAMVARVCAPWDVTLMFEPGRVIVGNAGVLLTRAIRVKRSSNNTPFVIVDAAMNDLARPAMYGAWHDFDAVRPTGQKMTAHIVGPICESGDFLGHEFYIRRDVSGAAVRFGR